MRARDAFPRPFGVPGDPDPIESQRFDEPSWPHYRCKNCGVESSSVAKPCPECGGSWQKVDVLAGPESAAEHVRNALQLLYQTTFVADGRLMTTLPHEQLEAARARLRAALAALEAR